MEFFILVLGGIGMVIPTPGGIGSYHAIAVVGLTSSWSWIYLLWIGKHINAILL